MINKRKSIRLKEYDYASAGAYHVTLFTWHRKSIFGEIIFDEVHLNPLGEIVRLQWLKSADIRQEIILDEFIVMPNHFHAIVVIISNHLPPTKGDQPVAPTSKNFRSRPDANSLGALVAGFKSACTKEINLFRKTPKTPVWQRNYHDGVIRNGREINAVREYIKHNPISWSLDPEFNSTNRISD